MHGKLKSILQTVGAMEAGDCAVIEVVKTDNDYIARIEVVKAEPMIHEAKASVKQTFSNDTRPVESHSINL